MGGRVLGLGRQLRRQTGRSQSERTQCQKAAHQGEPPGSRVGMPGKNLLPESPTASPRPGSSLPAQDIRTILATDGTPFASTTNSM